MKTASSKNDVAQSNTPLRIMHILPSLAIGGMENALIQLVNRYDRAKYVTFICCIEDDKRAVSLADKITNENATIFKLNKRSGIDMRVVIKLAKLISENRIDIIHARNWSSILYGSIAVMLSGKKSKIVADIRGKIHNRRHHVALKMLSPVINKFITVTHDLASELMNKARIDKKKIVVIHNGIDDSMPRSEINTIALKQEVGIDQKDLVVGSVGRLVKVKDYETLIKAFMAVSQVLNNLKLILVGDGPEKEYLMKIADELKIRERVIFLGFHTSLEKFYKIMDLFVLTSTYEGSSNTILEAMASGTPVIATNIGGNKEIIIDGKTGILTPPKDPETLAKNISMILTDNGFSKKMAENAKIRLKEHFSIDQTVKKYLNTYSQIVNRQTY